MALGIPQSILYLDIILPFEHQNPGEMRSQYFGDLYDSDPRYLPPRIHHKFVPYLDFVRQPQIDEALLPL